MSATLHPVSGHVQRAALTGQGVPGTSKPGQVLKFNSASNAYVWVDDPNARASVLGTSSSHHGIDPMPETQRSDSLAQEVVELRNVVSAQAQEIQRLRTEMDEIKALINDSRSRQLNGAGYWDPA